MRKLILSSLVLLSFTYLSFSQTPLENAVDFTCTDIEGNSHHLFEYLDAGHYVLMEFTYTG